MHCIVGLGNPGSRYQETRHNVGFILVDYAAGIFRIPLLKEKWDSRIGKGLVDSEEVILVKPLTFMNRSGLAVARILHFHKIPVQKLLVVHDDMDLPPGRLKIVSGGGPGGHNGVASIMETLGTQEFPRLKIGIGRPGEEDASRYVLEPFVREERAIIENVIVDAAEAVRVIILQGLSTAMNLFNTRRSPTHGAPPPDPPGNSGLPVRKK